MNILSISNINFDRKITRYTRSNKKREKIFDIYPQEALLKELKKNRDDLLDKLAFCKNMPEHEKLLEELKAIQQKIKDIED